MPGNHNSGRRPHKVEDKMRLGRLYPKAIAVLEALLDGQDTPAHVLGNLATYIIDQHIGRARQVTEVTGSGGGPIQIQEMTDADLAIVAAQGILNHARRGRNGTVTEASGTE